MKTAQLLAGRWTMEEVREMQEALAIAEIAERPAMSEPAALARYILSKIEEPAQEEFHAIFLDTRNKMVGSKMITRGTLDRSSVHPREVFTAALLCGGVARIIVAHNHPSHDTSPSPQDIKVTEGLAEAGRIMGIEVLDHVIVGSAPFSPLRFTSLRETMPHIF